MIDILLVDDHAMIRDAIKFYFEGTTDYQVAGEAANGSDALQLLRNSAFEVVMTDINMPDMDGIELMGKIQTEFPSQKVLVLSMLDDAVYINKMIALGARGYILKNAPREELFT